VKCSDKADTIQVYKSVAYCACHVLAKKQTAVRLEKFTPISKYTMAAVNAPSTSENFPQSAQSVVLHQLHSRYIRKLVGRFGRIQILLYYTVIEYSHQLLFIELFVQVHVGLST
jgi:hypothetical protein